MPHRSGSRRVVTALTMMPKWLHWTARCANRCRAAAHGGRRGRRPYTSRHAVYVPAKKLWARDDPWFIQRIPITQVRHVLVKRTRTLTIVVVATLMIALGSFFAYFMLEPIVSGRGGRVSGWPIAIVVGGIVLPFVARGRRSLQIVFNEGKYRWTPPLVVDKASRNYIHQLLEHIIGGFRAAGVNVITDTNS